ncbi:MAG: succinylglutamate desuccinylase/aspartoacylase family protein [bacterium]
MNVKNLPGHIYQIKGVETGPSALILGGTHGDEIAGIEIVRVLLKQLGVLHKPARVYNRDDIKGNLFIGFGNPEAILRNTRGASANLDLNRAFEPALIDKLPEENDPLDLKRARELLSLLRSVDYLFDIHSTSSPSKPFLCLGKVTPGHKKLFPYIPTNTILTDPNAILAKHKGYKTVGTTDFVVNSNGGVGFGYETGQAKDLAQVKTVVGTVVKLLCVVGMTDSNFINLFDINPKTIKLHNNKQKIYKLTCCILAKENKFKYNPGMQKGWLEVKKGQKVGIYESGREEITPTESMYLFPKAPGKIKATESLYYLAQS